ncbi:MAG: hypothetical protein DRQ01_07110 [Ignavibacteriae bacterium]|nr:MAG: hypothetical protein DRQ01_07110 [Ignavibacteriota bacterium]
MESYFKLPNGDKVEFQICAFAREPTITFNGKFIVTEIRFSTVSEITKIKTCIVDLTVIYSLFGHPCIDPDEYRCKALVKFMY